MLAETADLHSRLLGSRFELRLGFEDVLFAKEAAKDHSGRRLGGWPERQGLVRGQGRLLRLHSASQGSVRPECAKDLAVEGLQVKFMLPFGPAVRCPKLATRYQEGNQEEPGAAFAAWWRPWVGVEREVTLVDEAEGARGRGVTTGWARVARGAGAALDPAGRGDAGDERRGGRVPRVGGRQGVWL